MIVKYLRAITPVRVFAGSESARRIDARVFGGGVLAGLALRLPAQGGPVVRRARGVATAPRERRGTLVPVEADGFFSPLGEPSVIGGVFPQVGTLIDGAVGARAPVRRVGAQVRALAVVARAPAAVRRSGAGGAGDASGVQARVRHRRMISQIVIIVGGHAGAAQVRASQRRAPFELS